jgi:FlaA1/EpsC-like NDP-sugar epimerase
MQEFHPSECFKNNVGGTAILVRACHEANVERFLLISTDKAVNPSSVMGATKRACELYCQAFSHMSSTKFLSVRFGNVLASDGSVVQIFLEQIADGGPVTITHPEVKRYFMTIPEAVTLVLQATALGESGQIMVLDMGEPIRIVDLAHQLMNLAGKDDDEIPIRFTGLKPGEKLFEELRFNTEVWLKTAHEKVGIFNQHVSNTQTVIAQIDRAVEAVFGDSGSLDARLLLREIVPEYRPIEETK